MNIKYYFATHEDKVGTVYSITEYVDNQFYDSHIGKTEFNGMKAFEDITEWLVKRDLTTNPSIKRDVVFKYENKEISRHMGNVINNSEFFDLEGYHFMSVPSIFKEDVEGKAKAQQGLRDYLTLRNHYIKRDLIK